MRYMAKYYGELFFRFSYYYSYLFHANSLRNIPLGRKDTTLFIVRLQTL